MGTFDTVRSKNIEIQIKSTACRQDVYQLGDSIDLPNGAHHGYEGFFIVEKGKIVYIGKDVYDKWGNHLPVSNILKALMKGKIDELAKELGCH